VLGFAVVPPSRSAFSLRWTVLALACHACRAPLAAAPEASAPPAAASAPVIAATPPAPAAAEASVKPGINDDYLGAKNIQPFVERFERHGREPFDRKSELLALLGLRPGQQVADVGSGTGLFTLDFARAVGDHGRVFALDITPAFLEHVRAKATAAGLGHVETRLVDPRDVGLAPASVDVAFLCDVYHHVEFPQTYMTSLRRALRPDGRLWIIDFERVPGRSEAWVLEHVRAGREVVEAELAAAGFVVVKRHDLLRENYILELRPGPATGPGGTSPRSR
jgi:SAM-dependent methyltransferase